MAEEVGEGMTDVLSFLSSICVPLLIYLLTEDAFRAGFYCGCKTVLKAQEKLDDVIIDEAETTLLLARNEFLIDEAETTLLLARNEFLTDVEAKMSKPPTVRGLVLKVLKAKFFKKWGSK